VAPPVCIDLPRDRQAPARARRALERVGLAPDVAPDAKLLVSELVTNSVKYGGEGEVTLKIRSEHPRHVHVEVVDQGSGFLPVERDRPRDQPGGWGLHLVERLARDWGVHEGSTHVWFELER
jgi:anti-sigma regulatory factor (Ser/Thr protein kinase)